VVQFITTANVQSDSSHLSSHVRCTLAYL